MSVTNFSGTSASVYSFEASKPASTTLSIPDGLYRVTSDAPTGWAFYALDPEVKLADAALYKKSGSPTLTFESNTLTSSSNPVYTLYNTGFGATSSAIYAIAYGNGVHVVAGMSSGSSPYLSTSTDGITWSTPYQGGMSYTPSKMIYAGGKFLIGMTNGYMYTSTDAVTWTNRSSVFQTSNYAIYGLSYGGGIYTAVGGSGTIATSTDAVTWTTRTANFGSADLKAVVYGGGRFTATGMHVSGNPLATTSTDGVTWTTRTTGWGLGSYTSLYSIGYGYSPSNSANIWAIGSTTQISISTDLTTWTLTSPGPISGNTVNEISYYNNTFYYAHNNGLAYSTDPASWSATALTTGIGGQINTLAYNNGVFIASGSSNSVSVSTAGFTGLNMLYGWDINTGTYGNGTYVVAGYAGAGSRSTTLTSWIQTQILSYGTSAWSSTFGKGKFVVGGDAGNIASSTDGVTWTAQTSIMGYQVEGLGYGNGVYLAGGAAGTLKTSTDAITWTTRTVPYGYSPRAFAYGNNTYVAMWSAGYVTTSTDGITWTARGAAGSGNAWNTVTYGNSLFVAGSDGGQIYTSTDGASWTSRTSNFSASYSIWNISYRGGLFVAVGGNGIMVTSTDGITWGARTSGFGTTTIRTAIANSGIFVLAGAYGYGYYHKTATSISPVRYLILESKGAPTVL